ncbi:MAG: CHRD domain-containing protein [Chloracidobacterium sp.]|nr:CHRD domain-containing protein [Chloracidobacterium sp.]
MFASKSSNRLVRGITSFAFVAAFLIFASTAFAGQRFTAVFSGAQEVPPTGSTATGYGYVEVNDAQTSITAYFGFSGLGTAATAAHIHTQAVGLNGPVTFPFAGFPLATSGTHTQTFAITAGQLATLQAGGMYFNVHSSGFPGGEIRGQILAPTCATAGPIEVESTSGTAVGVPTAYATLQAAFDAINLGVIHTGAINVEVCGNTTETASASLNSGTVAPASYTGVNVYPVGAARTITGNIIGAIIKLNGADNVTIDGRLGGTGTTRDLTVTNSSTSAATAAVWLASVVAGNGASNNVVRNLEIACGATQNTGTNSTIGIYMGGTTISTSAADGNDNDNNSFIANRIIRSRYGIVTRGLITNFNISPVITDNIIGPAAFGADQIGKVGIFMQSDTGATISRNTVQFVGGDFANSTGGADRVGIALGVESWAGAPGTLAGSNYTVTRNIVHDVIEERTFSSVGVLLAVTDGANATNNLVANNFVYNVNANGTAGDTGVGIGIAAGNGDRIVFNSVRMAGDSDPNAGAGTPTQTNVNLRIANTPTNLTVRNNSLYNDVFSSSAPALLSANIQVQTATFAFGTGGLSNNNYYFPAANLTARTGTIGTASLGTTFFATLANWQAAITPAQDVGSIQADPQYLSATDLHIGSISPNESAGLLIAGVTDDIDGDARAGATDIGADEITLAGPGTLQFSSGTYASNEGTTVTITVNRVGGVTGAVAVNYATSPGTATAGTCGAGGDYVAASGTLNWANGDGAAKTFTIPLCTDLVSDPAETVVLTLSSPVGTTITGTNPATLTIGDVPPPFNGTYTVGSGGNYPSLTNAGGIFEAINLGGASGNITINITADLTGELGTNALNEIAGGFNVLIKPSGAPRTITGSNTGALIRFNGTDRVTVDGSTTGATATGVGGNAALRELTIQNTNVGTGAAVMVFLSGVSGAQNNTVRNVNILGQDPTTTLIGLAFGGNTVGTVGTDNDNNRVENCSVKRAIFGIYSAGASLANPNTGTVITMNETSAVATDRIRRVGIMVFNDNGIQITQNSINGISTTESADGIGIAVGTQGVDTTGTTSGGITNALVARNKINGVSSLSAVGFSAAGITVAGDVGGANTIANNMITGVTSPATSPDIVAGIFVVGATGSSTRLYYNSVANTGDRGTVATQSPSFGIAVTGTDPTVELFNNIFYTTQVASGGGVNAKSYAIGMVTTTFVNLNSNYNDFFSTGANDGGFRSGSLTAAAGTDYATVALWGAAVADDANSITLGEVDPGFVDPLTNLHLKFSPVSPVLDKGIAVSVLDDFDGQIRSIIGLTDFAPLAGGIPDIGADELGVTTAAGVSVGGRVMAGEGRGLRGAVVTMTSMDGTMRNVVTGAYGMFRFDDVEPGQTYIVSIRSRRFMYSPQTVVVNDNIADLSFIAGQ